MGYYLDLYLSDNSKPQSREAMVELFCANGCIRHFEEEFPDMVEVRCLIPEYNDFFLITFQESIKEPPNNFFAYIRLGSYPNRDWYNAIIKVALQFADSLVFYVYDSLLSIRITEKNIEQVIDNIIYGNSKVKDLLGGIKNEDISNSK